MAEANVSELPHHPSPVKKSTPTRQLELTTEAKIEAYVIVSIDQE
ncbi:MAG: hypothetical protein Q7R66_20950 [Undibacterium sp.]|nr:hypothetical protein [Undibacterium sp.]MDO8654647.1 hypothetical protein [Undibacterium sp.]